MSACENSNSKDFDDLSPKQEDSNDNQVKDGSCKRKRTQISIVEYFSKRKRPKEDQERRGMEFIAMKRKYCRES